MNGASSRRCSRWWRFTRGCCIRLSPQLGSLWYYWWCFTLRYVYTCLCEKRAWSTGGHSYTLFFPSFPVSFEPLVQRGSFSFNFPFSVMFAVISYLTSFPTWLNDLFIYFLFLILCFRDRQDIILYHLEIHLIQAHHKRLLIKVNNLLITWVSA